MKKFLLILICASIAFKANCQIAKSDSMQYGSVGLEKDDKTFLRLKDTAQKHLPAFINKLNKYGKNYKTYRFVVKSDFVQNGQHEHMWSRVFEYRNGAFIGIFIDSAFTVKNVKMGDKVAINKNKIEDWNFGYVNSNKAIMGNFSDKYLESQMKKPGSK